MQERKIRRGMTLEQRKVKQEGLVAEMLEEVVEEMEGINFDELTCFQLTITTAYLCTGL